MSTRKQMRMLLSATLKLIPSRCIIFLPVYFSVLFRFDFKVRRGF